VNEEHKRFIEVLAKKAAPISQTEKRTYITPNYDPSMQLRGIRQFVQCLRMESAGNSSSIAIARNIQAYNHERGGDAYADDCADAMYFDATVSGAIVASFAQFIEGLFKYEFFRLSQNRPESIKLNSKRYKGIESAIASDKKNKTANNVAIKKKATLAYWDPHTIVSNEGKCVTNIADGISELCRLYEIENNMPKGFSDTLTAIFQYRNYVMHNGVEWEDKEIRKFKANTDKLSFDAFQWSTRNGVESIAFISDQFINHTLSLCECCLEHVWFCNLDG